ETPFRSSARFGRLVGHSDTGGKRGSPRLAEPAVHHTHGSELAPRCEIPDIVRARDRELPARSVRASWRLRKPASVILVAAGLFVFRGSPAQILYKRPSFRESHEDRDHGPSLTYRS